MFVLFIGARWKSIGCPGQTIAMRAKPGEQKETG